MPTFVLRVALVDRPGALGAVASRIGAVRGDVVAVEIVERGGGRAVDEFVVELADDGNLPLLLSEIAEVDGVAVEEAHPVSGSIRDRRIDAYETAALIVAQHAPHKILTVLTSRARQELDARWAAVVDVEQHVVIASDGTVPNVPWLAAYVERCRRREPPAPGDEEMHWVELAAWDLVLVVARPGWRFGTRERDRMAALARLADTRWASLPHKGGVDPPGMSTPDHAPRPAGAR